MGNSRLNRVRNWDELAQKVSYSFDQLATGVSASAGHLRRYLKRKKGERAHSWILNLRLAEALPLLQQGMPIKQVAFILGFKQPSHFCRVFKRKYGVPPSHYSTQLPNP